jgi:Bacterial capsule synthesis protein PGA_cap
MRRNFHIVAIAAFAVLGGLATLTVQPGRTPASGPTQPRIAMHLASAPVVPRGLHAAGTFVPRQFTVLGAGDILLHPGLWKQGREDAAAAGRKGFYFDPIFASAVPDISGADLAICHMETPYGPADGPFKGYPVFAVPPQIAQTIHDIGYDSCSTASNHSLDDGQAGIDRELDALDAAGVKHTGSARSAADAARPDLLQANGVTVAQLSYAYGFNGIPLPADKPWMANLINVPAILAAAHTAKADGAQVVIVSLHFGTEYQQAPNAQQLSLARTLLASPDIDLILGAHVHVPQPFQEIDGKWIAYGMGNQIATQPFSKPTQDGVMPRFTFTETSPGHFQVTKAEAIPTFDYMGEDGGPYRLIDLPRALATPGLDPRRKALYAASWHRTATEVDKMGAAKDGLVVVAPGQDGS